MKERSIGRWLPIVTIGAVAMLLLYTSAALGASERVVRMLSLRYTPATVTVVEGGMVTWRNEDSVAHTVTADGGGFDTGSIAPGQSRSLTFLEAGRYPYHCEVIPSIRGTVVVRAAAAGSPTASPSFPSTDTILGTGGGGSTGAPATALIAMLVLAGAGGWLAVRSTRTVQPAYAVAGVRAGRVRTRSARLRPVSDLAPQRNIAMLHRLHEVGGWDSVEQMFLVSGAPPATVEAVREFVAEQEDWRAWRPRPRGRLSRVLRRPH